MSETRYIAWTGNGDEVKFATATGADRFMRKAGLEPTDEWASDAITEGGRILWDGECQFYAEVEGEYFKDYPDGYEPRVRVLHRVGEARDDED